MIEKKENKEKLSIYNEKVIYMILIKNKVEIGLREAAYELVSTSTGGRQHWWKATPVESLAGSNTGGTLYW